MISARRDAYLEAMDIDRWVLRQRADDTPPAEDRPAANANATPGWIYAGPGDGNVLMLCRNAAEAATQLAADVARCLDAQPVWGWPVAPDENHGGSDAATTKAGEPWPENLWPENLWPENLWPENLWKK